ncbi:hypothetical protein DFS34DRAFT_596150 [Phlyctochytrium arcticum]|nr:hypothetical protein DFS34DRAFT_596150 [Phlyctochytrium arcticum]
MPSITYSHLKQQPKQQPLPLEIFLHITQFTSLSTLSHLHQTCHALHRLLPTPIDIVTSTTKSLLFSSHSSHEALGRAIVYAPFADICTTPSHITAEIPPGGAAQLSLIRLLVQKHGAKWERALTQLWTADRKAIERFSRDIAMAARPETGAIGADRLQKIALWEIQSLFLSKYCKSFAKVGDVEMVRSFVPALGLFEVASLTLLPEIVREAEHLWLSQTL